MLITVQTMMTPCLKEFTVSKGVMGKQKYFYFYLADRKLRHKEI